MLEQVAATPWPGSRQSAEEAARRLEKVATKRQDG